MTTRGARLRIEEGGKQKTSSDPGEALAITSPRASYFYQGVITSGLTVDGKGTYHRVGSPQTKYDWSILLGGDR
jgi:hypothetical protein